MEAPGGRLHFSESDRTTYQEKRNITCVMRMNPPCETICPNVELPSDVESRPANCGRLKTLTTSIFTCACLPPLRPMFFATDKSVLMIRGVRTSVSMRGALPHVPAGARPNAAGLSHAAVGWSADPSRSANSPGVSMDTPVRFGRMPLPSRLLFELL